MKFFTRAALLGVLFVPLAHPALAADCGPLQRLASVDLAAEASGAMLVPVSINGVPKQMLLNTAAGLTELGRATAESLNMHMIASNAKLLSSSGNVSTQYVKAASFEIGKINAKDVDFMIAPDSNGVKSGADGSLAGDLLSRFDVEIDFAAHKLNFFSPDHCAGQVIYWPAQAVAVTPFTLNRAARNQQIGFGFMDEAHNTHIRVPVSLDGKDFFAVINTASRDSTITAETAKYVFGVTADSPDSVAIGPAGGDPAKKAFGHVFKSLTFDGISVTNAHFIVIPTLMGAKDPENEYSTGSHLQLADEGMQPEITVGLDVLRHLHLYIAYGERKLYLDSGIPAPGRGETLTRRPAE